MSNKSAVKLIDNKSNSTATATEKEKKSQIIADIRVQNKDGSVKKVATQIKIPLIQRATNTGYFDLIASLKKLPILRDTTIEYIGVQETTSNGTIINKPAISVNSADNVMSPSDLSEWWKRHDGLLNQDPRKVSILIHRVVAHNGSFKCHMCDNKALNCDIDLNLPFCSLPCWENYVV